MVANMMIFIYNNSLVIILKEYLILSMMIMNYPFRYSYYYLIIFMKFYYFIIVFIQLLYRYDFIYSIKFINWKKLNIVLHIKM